MPAFIPDDIFLITGASSGIGRAIASLLNSLGATVIAVARNADNLETARKKVAFPERFHVEPRDVLDDMDALPDWVRSLRERYGKLRGLVPCAGYSLTTPLRAYTVADGNAMFNIHYHAPILLAKGFSDRRNNIGEGASIVFISSTSTVARVPGLITYGAAKAAIKLATASLSKELAPLKIRVNAVAPGMVETPMLEQYVDLIDHDVAARERALYPFNFGKPLDVANLVAFLLSAEAGWITGQHIVADGGRY